MATSQSTDIRALLGGGADEDRLALSHFIIGAMYLVLGGLLALFALLSLRFPDQSPVSFGRIQPMASIAVMLGFGAITLTGGVYYVMPRLTGARLAHRGVASLGLLGATALAGLSILAVFLGLGDGTGPLGLPWWLDIPIAATLAVPALVVLGTVRQRTEQRSYVTVWFVIAGAVWLPLLYLATSLASLDFANAVSIAFSDVSFDAGFVNMWLLVVGSGLFYYSIVKELDVPLASRQLAFVGLWSLGFAAFWWGSAQLIFGPGPNWLDGVAAALGLALPIGALANAANFSLTLEKSWRDLPDHPGLSSGVIGSYLAVVVGGLAAFGSFPSIGAAVALTSFWDGVEYAALLGIGPLLAAGLVFPALPRLSGRNIANIDRVRTFNRMTVVGVVGVLISLVAAGLYTGYAWIGGSNSAAYIDAGEGWAQAGGSTVETLVLIAVGFGVISLLGQLSYAGVVLGTVTTGNVVAQEVLVEKEDDSG